MHWTLKDFKTTIISAAIFMLTVCLYAEFVTTEQYLGIVVPLAGVGYGISLSHKALAQLMPQALKMLKLLPLVALVFLPACSAKWTPAEKSLGLADGFCLEVKVAEIGGSVGHCAEPE